MRLNRETVAPAFEPITITLDTIEEAQALKRICTTPAIDAVVSKPNVAVSGETVREVGDSIFRALKGEGITYLVPKDQRS